MIKEGVLIGDRYEIMGRIGTGGMADVYKGRDHKLNRYVALKVLKREFREDELFVKKFQSEAQAAAGLMHPNIVNVYDLISFFSMIFYSHFTFLNFAMKNPSLSCIPGRS